ncbi:hypothetical protein GCM10023340_36550 [Nocardioides marinquilinus]|uniref:Uncharacterized protein n=1 Tax=Nocardioides marinquilinus TaxID=1210400 RepID=A0ABP9PXI9_9ACTN
MTNDPHTDPIVRKKAILSMAGRKGAHASWARTLNRSARTSAARAALDAKFLAEADGDPKRAESLRRAYFADLALRSAQARRNRKGAA